MTLPAAHLSISSVVKDWAGRTPDAVALSAPGCGPLTYLRLAQQIERTVEALNIHGVGRDDRVAIALNQGAEMAAAILSVAAGAASAPLNPALGEEECQAALCHLEPTLLIVPSGTESFARHVAVKKGWPVLELVPVPDGNAGEFTLDGRGGSGSRASGFGQPDDCALILPTSGTSSQPRWVPLTHRNILAAADNTRTALQLTEHDRCLNVMPLFHSHGLIAGVLATIIAGGTVVCTPGFDTRRFFAWLGEVRPTWFTAVPTMHRAIVAAAPQHRATIDHSSLRFIRSASAPLSSQLQVEMERIFGVLVTESYGLTEAPQITNTPLDARSRRIGSLGISGTSEVAIMDEAGRLLGPHEIGEIVCRGSAVATGYHNDPVATERSFANSWFRTGDQGFVDSHGHLHMTGRLKEAINHGGEEVSPTEVDRVLVAHPAIAEAATFGLPDPVLGEQVAAAVVLRPHLTATSAEIRAFAADRLVGFKVPRRVLIVPSLPLGPTGKVQRRELPAQLGLLDSDGRGVARAPASHGPRNLLEHQLVQMWKDVFGLEHVGITDDFFDLGGTSLLAARLMAEIEEAYDRRLHPSLLFSASTIQALARHFETSPDPEPGIRPLTEVQRGAERPPFVFLHGHYIGGGLYCRDIARGLDPRQPFYTLSPYTMGLAGSPTTIEGLAGAYLQTLRASQPVGPYYLGGYSHAGLIALEMARWLTSIGEQVPLLAVLDVPISAAVPSTAQRLRRLAERSREGPGAVLSLGLEMLKVAIRRARPKAGKARWSGAHRIILRRMIQGYAPRPYAGPVVLFTSLEGPVVRHGEPTLGWRQVATDLRVVRIPGDHSTFITAHAGELAQRLQECLDEAQIRSCNV